LKTPHRARAFGHLSAVRNSSQGEDQSLKETSPGSRLHFVRGLRPRYVHGHEDAPIDLRASPPGKCRRHLRRRRSAYFARSGAANWKRESRGRMGRFVREGRVEFPSSGVEKRRWSSYNPTCISTSSSTLALRTRGAVNADNRALFTALLPGARREFASRTASAKLDCRGESVPSSWHAGAIHFRRTPSRSLTEHCVVGP
jgi:hypothetical protein